MAYCTKCGMQLEVYQKFCSSCGYPVQAIDEDDCVNRVIDEDSLSQGMKRTLFKKEKLTPIIAHKTKFKYFILLIPFILVSVVLYSIFMNKPKAGNSMDNLNNGGIAAVQNNWVYYSNSEGLYRMNTKDGQSKKIADGFYRNLNVVGDWIYCYSYPQLSPSSTQSIDSYKIKTDGSVKEKLENRFITAVIGHDIYSYKISPDASQNAGFYRNNDKLTLEDNEYVIGAKGDSLYVIQSTDYNADTSTRSTKNFDMNKNSGNRKLLYEGTLSLAYSSIHIEDDYIYYIATENPDSGGAVIKYNINSKQETKLIENNVTSFNIDNGWIYYGVYQKGLYKLRIDSEKSIFLAKNSEQSPASINVTGDWIFYSNQSGSLFKIKTDGSNASSIGNLRISK